MLKKITKKNKFIYIPIIFIIFIFTVDLIWLGISYVNFCTSKDNIAYVDNFEVADSINNNFSRKNYIKEQVLTKANQRVYNHTQELGNVTYKELPRGITGFITFQMSKFSVTFDDIKLDLVSYIFKRISNPVNISILKLDNKFITKINHVKKEYDITTVSDVDLVENTTFLLKSILEPCLNLWYINDKTTNLIKTDQLNSCLSKLERTDHKYLKLYFKSLFALNNGRYQNAYEIINNSIIKNEKYYYSKLLKLL